MPGCNLLPGVLCHVSSARFRLGLAARADRLMRDAAPNAATAIATAARRLAGTGDGEMGRLFKVLALAHPQLGTPPAFDPSEEFTR